MERLQVLVATMGQRDLALAEKMNICCSAVIANQAEEFSYVEAAAAHGDVKMITTATRGVGLNRNTALFAASAELVLLADDDVVYHDDMPREVIKAFDENPQADVIIFGMDITKNGEVVDRRHFSGTKRLRVWNAMRYGTYTIAARREALLRCNITFHRAFGGGCMYSAGEDSLFLKNCFDHGLRVYAHPYVLGTCCKDTSSWFTEYGEKYFYDKGALVRSLFPRFYPVMGLYFSLRFKRHTDVKPMERVRLVYAGMRGVKTLRPYREGL